MKTAKTPRMTIDTDAMAESPYVLTYEAEQLGRETAQGRHPLRQSILILEGLLEHRDAVVREGAIYGLVAIEEHWSQAIAAKLRQVAKTDVCPGVRNAARDAVSS